MIDAAAPGAASRTLLAALPADVTPAPKVAVFTAYAVAGRWFAYYGQSDTTLAVAIC
ncbi:hypothetical protein [Amycolatopsis sp. cmx-8-4]|uniref:hypothetical protein n=1 Tax=Amycolatopsis sp. cmx-8-4 TaxID=2790947 RepID=UPI00397803CB